MPFDVKYRDQATQTTTEVTGVDDLFLDVTGLSDDTAYEFQVREVTSAGSFSGWSAWTAFSTTPIYVDATAAADAGLTTTAGATVDAVTFTVEYREVGGAVTTVTGVADTQLGVTGLTSAQDHEFRVKAVRADGAFSGWTAWAAFTTATPIVDAQGSVALTSTSVALATALKDAVGGSVAASAAVADTVVTQDATGSASAALTAVSTSLETFDVEWRDEDTQTTTLVTGITDTFLDVTGLSEGTPYEFRVRTVRGSAQGDWTAWTWFNTKADIDAAANAVAASTATGDAIFTQDGEGIVPATLVVTADAGVTRKTGGVSAASLAALNLGLDVTTEGSSFTQGFLFAAGDAHADKTGSGTSSASLSASGAVGDRVEVNAQGDAAAVLTPAGESTLTKSIASFQGSSLVALGSPTNPVLAAGSATATSTGSAAPEVTRGVAGTAGAVLSTSGEASIGRSVVGTANSVLSTQGDGFIDRGFEIAADVFATSTGSATAAYDAVVEASPSSVGTGSAVPASTYSATALAVSGFFSQATPAKNTEAGGSASAQGTGQANAESVVVVFAGGSAASVSTASVSTIAVTIDFSGFGVSALSALGTGLTNQEGDGSASAVLYVSAETVGGTPIYPGYMTYSRVTVIPAMSCYTKIVPTMHGNAVLRPR